MEVSSALATLWQLVGPLLGGLIAGAVGYWLYQRQQRDRKKALAAVLIAELDHARAFLAAAEPNHSFHQLLHEGVLRHAEQIVFEGG